MVKVKEDLTGRDFGRLTVLGQTEDYVAPDGRHVAVWLCQCSCEEQNIISIPQHRLKAKNGTRSCGCINRENLRKRNKKENEYVLTATHGILWTNNTDEPVYFDLIDADNILKYCWCKNKGGYAVAKINGKMTKMHQFLGLNNFDHANRNKLDNRRNNLRQCTLQQNSANRPLPRNNTSGFIGVSYSAKKQKWKAQIGANHQTKTLGYFVDKTDALIARLKAEKEAYGEFAPQRHLFEEYGII